MKSLQHHLEQGNSLLHCSVTILFSFRWRFCASYNTGILFSEFLFLRDIKGEENRISQFLYCNQLSSKTSKGCFPSDKWSPVINFFFFLHKIMGCLDLILSVDWGCRMFTFLFSINMEVVFNNCHSDVNQQETLCDVWLGRGKLTYKKSWALHYMGHQRNPWEDSQETVGGGTRLGVTSS